MPKNRMVIIKMMMMITRIQRNDLMVVWILRNERIRIEKEKHRTDIEKEEREM